MAMLRHSSGTPGFNRLYIRYKKSRVSRSLFSLFFPQSPCPRGRFVGMPPKAAGARALLPSCKEERRFLPSDYQSARTVLLLLRLLATKAKTRPPRGAATGVTLRARNPHRKEGLEVMIAKLAQAGKNPVSLREELPPKDLSSAPFSPRGSALGCLGEVRPDLSPRERDKGINHIPQLHLLSSALLIS